MESGSSEPRQIAREWLAGGRRVVAGTLIDRIGSSPLDPGAEIFFNDQDQVEGTVTGGCVESALAEEAAAVLGGAAPKIVSYGVSDDEATGTGLMCGGTVRVFVHELSRDAGEALAAINQAQRLEEPAALTTVLDGPNVGAQMAVLEDRQIGTLGLELLDHNVEREAWGFIEDGASRTRSYGPGGEVMGYDVPVMFQTFQSPPELLIYGAIDFSAALARLAEELGYRVTICDARKPFAEGRRFAEVAEVVVDWPDRDLARRELSKRDVVLVFTHDRKFDGPALKAALDSEAGYIGALGSRRTQAERTKRLREDGVSESQIARIHAPCGLDIGARTPEETAISILAEIVVSRTGRSGERLRDTDLPIHVGT